jgi:hypothetical protein
LLMTFAVDCSMLQGVPHCTHGFTHGFAHGAAAVVVADELVLSFTAGA